MRRRTLLAVTAASLPAAAGCTGVLDSDDGGDDGSGDSGDGSLTPEGAVSVVGAFYDASLAGNGDEARSLIHSDAEIPPPEPAAISQMEASDARLEDTSVIEQEADRVVVRATVSSVGRGGTRQEREVDYELRPENGAWRLYDQPLPGGERSPVPTVQWDTQVETGPDGVEAVTFTHGGGDDVAIGSLGVRVGESTLGVTGTGGPVQAGDAVRLAFATDGEPVPAGTDVELLWNDGEATPLAVVTVLEATTGAPATSQLDAR